MAEREVTPQELMRAFRQLRHTNWKGKRPVEGCTHSETMMLFVLRHLQEHCAGRGAKVSELSTRMRVSAPTVTQMINVLEARGLLERGPDPADRRVVRIQLTEKGLKETQIAEAAMMESLNGLIEHIGKEKAAMMIELFDQIHDYYKKQEEEQAHD